MFKESIVVPGYVEHLSDWKEFKLKEFPHILDKQIPGCGFTNYCIVNDQDMILCSPRRVLLENKEEQRNKECPGSVLYVRNELDKSVGYDRDITKNPKKVEDAEVLLGIPSTPEEIKEAYNKMYSVVESFIMDRDSLGKPVKLLVTYDSYRLLKGILNNMGIFDRFYTVVDEFQSIFTDSKFKSDTEIEFINQLKDVRRLCYVSATPMIEEYLEMLEEFKDLPYYELDWITDSPLRVIKPDLKVRTLQSITSVACNIIQSYKEGRFEEAVDDKGKLIQSREAVFYINSVTNLLGIIKKAKLEPEEVNILCAKTDDNERRILKTLGKRFSIGRVPIEGDPHKMFTFCTRTVYVGADFYSTCARSFIMSDANIQTLAVDITLDLPQILGRQRLKSNPWMNRAELYFKTICEDKAKSKIRFDREIARKKKVTNNLLLSYTTSPTKDSKHDLAETYKIFAASRNYKDNYVAVNIHEGSDYLPVFNNLVLIAEMRAYDIQQIDYADRFMVINRLTEKLGGTINSRVVEFTHKFENLKDFYDRMKLLCEFDMTDAEREYVLGQIPVTYKTMYKIVGPEKMRALGYNNTRIHRVLYDLTKVDIEGLKERVQSEFEVGKKYLRTDIKDALAEIYEEVGYNKIAKATDIEEYFVIKKALVTNKITKKRDHGFLIVDKK